MGRLLFTISQFCFGAKWPLVALVLASACDPRGARVLECLAPANAGGGWDLTCRTVSRLVDELDLVSRPMRVRNMPGAGGGVAYAHVVAERRGDESVIVAASPATTLRLAQGQFGSFTPEDVRWLGAVAADYGVVAVRKDAAWRNLGELLDAWRRSPKEIVAAGGSAVGGQDHMKLLLLAVASGLEPRSLRYVPFDGGGEAVAALLGGFVQVVPADGSEIRSLFESGEVRLLASLSEERLGAPFEKIPTAREQGYDVQWIVWRGFYAPNEIDAGTYRRWVGTLGRLESSPEWATVRRAHALSPFFLGGAEFERFVDAEVRRFAELTRGLGLAR